MTNQNGNVFECRTPTGEVAATHTVLSKVKPLLKDTKFTAVCGPEPLKTALLAKAIEKKRKFKAE